MNRDRIAGWFLLIMVLTGWWGGTGFQQVLVAEEVCPYPAINLPETPSPEDIINWAFLWEHQTWNHISPADPISPAVLNKPAIPGGPPYWPSLIQMAPPQRQLTLLGDMIGRLEAKGLDVANERVKLSEFTKIYQETKASADPNAASPLYMAVRLAKRQLMLRDPELEPLTRILFVKRFPYEPSHNYTDHMDAKFKGGGGICILDIPRIDGRLEPASAKVTKLFDAGEGIPRDPVADFDAGHIYFAYRPAGGLGEVYWHLMRMNADGSELKPLTDGRFHDYYPCPLPDGGLAFVTTRISCRFLCFVPLAFTLHRMNDDGSDIRALSHANLTEWGPSVMRDGRILWTRSEYQDKGANFGHTLWAIRPDGTQPELIYGNDTNNCIMNGGEVPGTNEYIGTMISHFGDFNGPIALINPEEGRFNKDAVTNITPDVAYGYDTQWGWKFGYKIPVYPDRLCFRDPIPVSSDYYLVSHSPQGDWNAPSQLFGIYIIDRYGNRELLYLDPNIGSMTPTPLRPRRRPPVLASMLPKAVAGNHGADIEASGQFILSDVYQGLTPAVERGAIKYLRICEELKSKAEVQADSKLREEYGTFTNFYSTPIFPIKMTDLNKRDVIGPGENWPTYVAKGVEGIVPVEEDGSARFTAPADKVLYFQALDKDLNEIQRMRSVIQLQANETRSCIGCHESRAMAPPNKPVEALAKPARPPQAPPWGKGPFDYQKVVQPVFDKNCISCHNTGHEKGINLTGVCDPNMAPASYRTLITKGLVDYYNCNWGAWHDRTVPMEHGVMKSKLIQVLEKSHNDVKLTNDEMHALKCWIDLNCPLWPDYQDRQQRACSTNECKEKGK